MGRTKQWLWGSMIWLLAVATAHAQIGIQVSGRKCAPTPGCGGDSTVLKGTGINVREWNWNFGDPGSGTQNTSQKQAPKHLYQSPGQYTIRLSATLNNGTVQTKDTTVTIGALPAEPRFVDSRGQQIEDTTICDKERGFLILDPYKYLGGAPKPQSDTYKYNWFPYGETTPVIRVDSSGCYSVTVTDTLTGCPISARINVKICGEQPPPPKSYWYFGNQAGILFEGGQPRAITDSKLNAPAGTSVYTDSKNRLTFYTDGRIIYDREGKLMKLKGQINQDTTTLSGAPKATQSVLVVQQPGCRSCEFIYYIFTTQQVGDSARLSYSIVDMNLNGGKGEIIEQNVPLAQPTTERLTSAKSPTDTTWIVTHDYKSNVFRIYKLTRAGLSLAGTYPIGSSHDTPERGQGQAKISPDATKMAVVVPGPPRNTIEIFDFDNQTGRISNRRVIDLGPAPPKAYGLEFSPDASKVYVTLQGDSTQNPKVASLLLQFDLSLPDSAAIARSRSVLDSTTTEIFGSLQFAPDNKIYVAKQGRNTLATINAPDNPALGADYDPRGFSLGGRTGQLGLPNLVQNDIEQTGGPGISVSDTCFGGRTQLQASPWCETKNEMYRWKYEYNGPNPPQGGGITAQLQYEAWKLSVVATTNWDTPLSKQTQTSHRYPRPGTYRVALYLKNDCKDTLLIQQLTIKPVPEANLGPDLDVCRNSVTLNANNSVPGAEYFWFRNGRPLPIPTPQISVRASGQYVVASVIDECFRVDTVNVTLRQPRPVNLGQDQVLCQGNSTSLDAGPGWNTYEWSTGANTQRIPVRIAGTYRVQVRDNTGCENADTIRIDARPRPTWQAAVRRVSACGRADGSITISNISPNDTYTYTWFKDGTLLPGATTGTLTNLEVGNYVLRLQGTASCDTIARFTVNQERPSIQIFGIGGGALCNDPTNGEVRISIQNSGAYPATYTLRQATSPTVIRSGTYQSITSPGGTPLVGIIRNVPPGDYIIELTDLQGCKTDTSFRVGIFNARLVDLGNDRLRCEGDTLQLDAGTLGDNYLWSTGERTQRIVVRQSGVYRVTVTNTQNQCQSTDEVQVTFETKPTVNTGPPLALCSNARPLTLTGATPNSGTWSGNGVANGVFTPSQQLVGNQSVTYTYTLRACTVTATRAIAVQQAPEPNLPPNVSFCDNTPQRVTAAEYPNAVYRWSNGATTASIEPSVSGSFVLTVTLGACRAVDTLNVRIFEAPRLGLRPEVPLCVAEQVTTVLDPGTGTGWTYRWSPTNETTRNITVSRAGIYTVLVETPDGCNSRLSSEVIERCEPRIYVPDLFTPNGDGANDRLDVYTAHIAEFDLKIYNRWGEVVFATNDANDKWDGQYRGLVYPPQSYAWVITYKSLYFPDRPATTKRGAVMLVR